MNRLIIRVQYWLSRRFFRLEELLHEAAYWAETRAVNLDRAAMRRELGPPTPMPWDAEKDEIPF